MSRKLPLIVLSTTKELERFLGKHLGKLEFGRVRLADKFPDFSGECGVYS
ncbi:MAG: hypothetical protein KKE50_02145 [Nanoarchaeota archaeon]|nr:hypothetical protein [Nanoarchaeota archaeon]